MSPAEDLSTYCFCYPDGAKANKKQADESREGANGFYTSGSSMPRLVRDSLSIPTHAWRIGNLESSLPSMVSIPTHAWRIGKAESSDQID